MSKMVDHYMTMHIGNTVKQDQSFELLSLFN